MNLIEISQILRNSYSQPIWKMKVFGQKKCIVYETSGNYSYLDMSHLTGYQYIGYDSLELDTVV